VEFLSASVSWKVNSGAVIRKEMKKIID